MQFEYFQQILVALIPLCITVILHGFGMDVVRRSFKRFGLPMLEAKAHPAARSALMVGIVAIMLVTHFAEVIVWAAFYFQAGMIGSVREAMFYSMEYYTTLAVNVHSLSGHWTGFGGFEAMTGMLMFGWSTAVLAAVVQRMHSIDH